MRPRSPRDARRRGGVGEHADEQGRRRPGRRRQRHRELAVDAVRCRGPEATTRSGRTEHPRREGHRVGAEVEHRAAGEVGAHDAVAVVEPLTHVGEHHPRLAEDTVGEQLANDVEAGQEQAPHRLHAEHAGTRRRVTDLPCLTGIQPDRLLDEHVLAGLDREQRVGQVEVVRGRDVDDVDLGVARRAPRRRRAPCRRRTRRRPGERPRRDRDPTACTTWRVLRCRAVTNLVGDPAGAEDAPAQRWGVHGSRGREGSAGATAYGIIAPAMS